MLSKLTVPRDTETFAPVHIIDTFVVLHPPLLLCRFEEGNWARVFNLAKFPRGHEHGIVAYVTHTVSKQSTNGEHPTDDNLPKRLVLLPPLVKTNVLRHGVLPSREKSCTGNTSVHPIALPVENDGICDGHSTPADTHCGVLSASSIAQILTAHRSQQGTGNKGKKCFSPANDF